MSKRNLCDFLVFRGDGNRWEYVCRVCGKSLTYTRGDKKIQSECGSVGRKTCIHLRPRVDSVPLAIFRCRCSGSVSLVGCVRFGTAVPYIPASISKDDVLTLWKDKWTGAICRGCQRAEFSQTG